MEGLAIFYLKTGFIFSVQLKSPDVQIIADLLAEGLDQTQNRVGHRGGATQAEGNQRLYS